MTWMSTQWRTYGYNGGLMVITDTWWSRLCQRNTKPMHHRLYVYQRKAWYTLTMFGERAWWTCLLHFFSVWSLISHFWHVHCRHIYEVYSMKLNLWKLIHQQTKHGLGSSFDLTLTIKNPLQNYLCLWSKSLLSSDTKTTIISHMTCSFEPTHNSCSWLC